MLSSHGGKLKTAFFASCLLLSILTTSGAMLRLLVIAALFCSTAAQTGCVCITDATLEADAQMYNPQVSANRGQRSADLGPGRVSLVLLRVSNCPKWLVLCGRRNGSVAARRSRLRCCQRHKHHLREWSSVSPDVLSRLCQSPAIQLHSVHYRRHHVHGKNVSPTV